MVDAVEADTPIRSDRVRRAFLTVPREAFVEDFRRTPDLTVVHHASNPTALPLIYANDVLVTRVDDRGQATSSSSMPALMAQMLDLLELEPGHRVLEVGAGTGYNAALMAEVVGDPALITSVDIDGSVANQTARLLDAAGYGAVQLLEVDGFFGVANAAPFDRIVATVGCTDVSPHWFEQLAPGGHMLIPLQHGGFHPLMRVADDGSGRVVGWSGFMPVQGELALERTATLALDETRRPLAPGLHGLTRDFQYYVGLADPRAMGFVIGLVSRHAMARVDASRGEIVTGGDADELVDTLVRYADEWRALGSPAAGDFDSAFVPLDGPAHPADDRKRWVVDRVVHRQLVRLR